MTILKNGFYLICLWFALSYAFSVDNLPKCSIKDSECQKNLYQNMIKEVGKPGIPELNIPPFDPIILKNVSITVLDLVNLTLIDGVAKGIKDCVFNSFEIDVDKGFGKQEIQCDITIKGHYDLHGDSAILEQLVDNAGLRGNGKGKVKLEKLVLNMKYPLEFERHDDGDIYYKVNEKALEYNYDIKGKASFAADNIYVGKENISEFVVKYLNENWKYVLKNFGRPFVDKAMEFYLDFIKHFYHGVSAKHFIIEDLTPYLS